MIDFLKLNKEIKNCECVGFSAHSIQLLPRQFVPYVFYIGFSGKPLEQIFIVDSYGNEHEMNYADTVFAYGYLSFKNIQFDDVNDVMFKLILNDNETYYSIPLKISSYNACKTTRVNFGCDKNNMQSISFPFWFKQNNRSTELTTGYDIATKSTISYSTANAKFMTYQTAFMNVDTLCDLNDALLKTYVYFDWERVSLFEAIEIEETEADANFIETKIKVNKYKGLDDGNIKPYLYLGTQTDDNYIVTEENNNIILE